MASEINRDKFLGISFSHHMEILHKTKNIEEVLFCIHEAVVHQWDKYTLRDILKAGIPQPDHTAPNNFLQTMSSPRQAMKAIRMFKDEYLLDFINVEDIDAQEKDVDERLVEQRIVHNIKRFIMTLGRDYNKPMGVTTYKTISDMPVEMQKTLPDIEELKKLMEDEE